METTHIVEYHSLLSLLEIYKEQKEDLKNQYLSLLSLLTKVEPLDMDDFASKVLEISSMGTILVCCKTDTVNGIVTIIGTGTIIIEPKIIRGGQCVGHVEDVVVLEEYRSHHVATSLLRKLMNFAHTINCYKVILNCKEELTGFYERLGYEQHGVQMSKYF
jgi:glucosamine-phosphate N-acetyltransferase